MKNRLHSSEPTTARKNNKPIKKANNTYNNTINNGRKNPIRYNYVRMSPYEALKQAAAKERRQAVTKENKKLDRGLASVQAVKTAVDAQKKQRDRAKTQEIMEWVEKVNKARQQSGADNVWNQPKDWRIVTGKALHKYIPFERNVTMSVALEYIADKLSDYGPPKKRAKNVDDETPIWLMSKNAMRTMVYRASVRRREFLDQANLSTGSTAPPTTNLGGEL